MHISYTLGLRHNFCCQGPISKLRPVLDSSQGQQTTHNMLLRFFCKTSKHACLASCHILMFLGGYRHNIHLLSSTLTFYRVKRPYAYFVRKSSSCLQIFNNSSTNQCFVLHSYHLYARALEYWSHTHQLDLLKNIFTNKPRHLKRTWGLGTREFDGANPIRPWLFFV